MKAIHNITVDMVKKGVTPRVYAMQYDTNARAVQVTLLANGDAWNPPEGAAISLSYQKPDGTIGFYSKLEDDLGAVSVSGNQVTVVLAHQVLTVAGIVNAAIVAIVGNQRIATFPFEIHVSEDPGAGSTASDDYFNPQGTGNAVLYVPQEISDAKKNQARENIGAASQADMSSLGLTHTVGKNLFDVGAITTGGWANPASGKIEMYPENQYVGNYAFSQYIPVAGGTSYTYSNANSTGGSQYVRSYVWYDADHDLILGEVVNSVVAAPYVLTAPDNAAYIILNFSGSEYDASVQFEKGDTFTEYAPYDSDYVMSGVKIPAQNIIPNGTEQEGRDDTKVSFTEAQELTDEQKAQARANIGAASGSFGTEKANRLMVTNTAGDMLPVQIDEAFLIETTQVTGVPPEINLYDAETMAVSGAWYVLNTDNTMRLQQSSNTGSYTAVAIPLHGTDSVTLQYHEDSKYAQIYRWFLADDEGNCIQSSAAAVNTMLNVPLTIPVPANADSLYISGKGNWVESKVMANAGNEASPYAAYTGIPESGAVTIFQRKNDIELSLPKRYALVAGDTFELFWRGILKALDPAQYYIEAVCDRGKPYQARFIYTPTAQDVGEHTLRVYIYDRMHTLLASGKTVLSVNAKGTTPARDTVVLYVGDSLANGGQVPDEFHRRLTATDGTPAGDGLGNISFIGTCVSGRNAVPYEGYGGWTFDSYNSENKSAAFMWITAPSHGKTEADQHSMYADSNGTQWKLETIEPDRLKLIRTSSTGTLPASGTLTWVTGGSSTAAIPYTASEQAAGNPFWDAAAGKVNFAKYAQAQGKTGIDYVYVLLGWNALNAKDEEITAAVRTFISNVHASFPSCKIVLLGLQMPAHDGLAHNYGASETWTYYNAMSHVVRLNRLYQQIAEENALVSFVQVSGQFDSAHNMPVLERTVNVRSTQKETYQSNGVHPMADGYYQIADACYRDFMRQLQSK